MDPIREPDDERDDGLDVSDLSLDVTGDGTSDGSLPVTGDAKIIKLVRKYKGKFKVDFDRILWRPVVNRPRFLWFTILIQYISHFIFTDMTPKMGHKMGSADVKS